MGKGLGLRFIEQRKKLDKGNTYGGGLQRFLSLGQQLTKSHEGCQYCQCIHVDGRQSMRVSSACPFRAPEIIAKIRTKSIENRKVGSSIFQNF